jgi:5'-methylthioadenosine phosphorylase
VPEPVPEPAIGVFGGSGFYSFLDDVEEHRLDTPYGSPSGPVAVGTIGDRRVVFIPRHGPRHTIAPAHIPQRANLWAMRTLGVRSVVGPCAVGSLRADVAPGEFVVLDQLVDRTRGREDTFYEGEVVHHVSFADPYCPVLRAQVVEAAMRAEVTTHAAGTIVVINGPRFSTRAESRWYRAQGWDVVGMTQYPEAYLARELGMHYTGIALVTDYDTGVEDDPGIEPVSMQQVLAVMDANIGKVRALLDELLRAMPVDPAECDCALAAGPLETLG